MKKAFDAPDLRQIRRRHARFLRQNGEVRNYIQVKTKRKRGKLCMSIAKQIPRKSNELLRKQRKGVIE